MNQLEQKMAAKAFVEHWLEAEGNEQREANSFWIELCGDVLGIPNPTRVLDFERKVRGRRIDVFYEDMGVLIENKSRGVDLNLRYERGKDEAGDARMVTPYEQAKWYADNMPRSQSPRWLLVCNFDEIRIHDLNDENPGTTYESIMLAELPDALHRLSFFTRKENSRAEREKELSVRAGEVVGKLYDAFSKAYLDIENDEREQRSLNILITRIVFLLFAEDAGILQEHQAFYKYLKGFQVAHMRQALIDLFSVLKTPEEGRDPYLTEELSAFPYVNGGLFAEDIVIPQFDEDTRFILLQEASAEFDWKDISPTIFGAVFESTLNPETRRAGGMHYTSVENIHKVTGPLVYDDLKDELKEIEGIKVEKERKFKLRAYRQKLASIKVLDPACGSGNFLTETYLSLRKLENRVLEDLHGGDQMIAFDADDLIGVSVDQFYGIEINDFAVEVAKTALWIAELQMIELTSEIVNMWIDPLPLKTNDNIHCGNALRMDWNDVLPACECSYIIGNPPFLGHISRSVEQSQELRDVWNRDDIGRLDYVTGWYKKAIDHARGYDHIEWAFVSTNSISMGEPVPALFEYVFDNGWRIKFAHRTFVWDSEATDKAHVHVVIIGFTKANVKPVLFSYSRIHGEPKLSPAENINGYLLDAPNVFIEQRRDVLFSSLNPVTMGNMPRGTGLIVEAEEVEPFLKDPIASKYLRKFLMGRELINSGERYCLWMEDLDPDDAEKSSLLQERIEDVRQFRLASKAKSTYDMAQTPHLFGQRAFVPTGTYLGIPKVFSGMRSYAICDLLEPSVIPGDKVYVCDDPDGFQFAMISSIFFIAWQKAIGGRLKSDCSFSNTVVWNNFPVPEFDHEKRQAIIDAGRAVLDARALHDGDSLARMYDGISPMPENPSKADQKKYDQRKYDDLLAAHKALDAAVEAAYGVDFNGDEEKIVAHLFKLYAEKTKGE